MTDYLSIFAQALVRCVCHNKGRISQMNVSPAGPIDIMFLCAGCESIRRATELTPLIAQSLSMSVEEMYHRWATTRSIAPGSFCSGEWDYFFHGMELDLTNLSDGRKLRIEFGPGGRTDIFSGDSVRTYAMTAVPPWKVFPALRDYLSDGSPTCGPYPGSFIKGLEMHRRMDDLGYLEEVAPELRRQDPPADDETDLRVISDYDVARRQVLSPLGREMAARHCGSG